MVGKKSKVIRRSQIISLPLRPARIKAVNSLGPCLRTIASEYGCRISTVPIPDKQQVIIYDIKIINGTVACLIMEDDLRSFTCAIRYPHIIVWFIVRPEIYFVLISEK